MNKIVEEYINGILEERDARIEARGRQEGRQEGTLETLMSLVNDGLLTLDDAALRAHMTPADFKTKAEALTAKS